MFQYILFDLDGTLTDPKEGICKSVQYALKKAGIEEPDLDRLEPFIGPPLTDSFRDFYQMDAAQAKKAVEDYRERFSVTGIYENKIYDGISELLSTLKARGKYLAVASSKPQVFVEKILKYFKIESYFDVVVGSELDGRRVKKEEVVQEALRGLYALTKETDPAEEADKKKRTIMVGDRRFDVEGAKAMGVASVGVEYGYAAKGELKKAGADYLAKNVKNLAEILLQTNQVPKEKTSELPKGAFFRSVYMLAPFAVFYLAYQIVGGTVLFLMQKSGNGSSPWMTEHSEQAAALIGSITMFLVSWVLYLIYKKSDEMPREKTRLFPSGVALAVTLSLGLNMLIGYGVTYFQVFSDSYEAAAVKTTLPFGLGILYYVFLSPLAEELVFRWLLYGRIKKGFGVKISVVISALFFGVYHGNVPQGIYAFIMGMLLAFLYEKSQNFLLPVVFHIVANGAVYCIGYTPETVKNTVLSGGSCVLFLAISVFLFWRIKEGTFCFLKRNGHGTGKNK